MDAAFEIISESVGINSFFVTFFLTIAVLPFFVWIFGPMITEECKEQTEEWLNEKYSISKQNKEQQKRTLIKKQSFIKRNQSAYNRWFIPLHNFNIAFGTGSLGVFIAFIGYQFATKGLKDAMDLFEAFYILLTLIFLSRMILRFSTVSVGFKSLDKNINVYRGIVTLFSIGMSITSFIEFGKILDKKTEDLKEQNNAAKCAPDIKVNKTETKVIEIKVEKKAT